MLVTAGSRSSPQVNIVASIGKHLGVPVIAHVPRGELFPEVQAAKNKGAEIIQHNAGYNNVIVARARECAIKNNACEIPFGMECEEAVLQTKLQVKTIPGDVKRIVVPVGSGMSLAGILHGIMEGNRKIEVVGIQVGADPIKRLNKYAPIFWERMVKIISSGMDYSLPIQKNLFCGIKLDPIYEAKCIPFLKKGDCLWIVGVRETLK